jgi:hypothetical protein
MTQQSGSCPILTIDDFIGLICLKVNALLIRLNNSLNHLFAQKVKESTMFSLDFQNQSNVVSDAELQAFIEDFQSQISNEFADAWGVDAVVDSVGTGWPITIMDYPGANDPQGALGYHSLDANFRPYGVVFAQLCLDNGVSWTSVASHEGLEILADPLIDSTVFVDTSNGYGLTGILVAQEVCDAPERLTYAGAINGTEVSDFVFPGWFIPGYPGKVDYLGQVPGPLLLASGGYVSYDQVLQATGWQQTFAARKSHLDPKNIQFVPRKSWNE